MSEKDREDVKRLRNAMNSVTEDIYNNWKSLSEHSLTGDECLQLGDDLDRRLRQVSKLSRELESLIDD